VRDWRPVVSAGLSLPRLHSFKIGQTLRFWLREWRRIAFSFDDVGLDSGLPGLPARQVDIQLPARLGHARRTWDVDLEPIRAVLLGDAADPPQEVLQVDELAWVTDEDVQAAVRSGVAATESPLSL
jgi:hypothetical protein